MNWYDAYSHLVRRDYNIKYLSSFRIGGTADFYAAPEDRETLIGLYRAALAAGVKVYVLGGGYNLLAPERVDGLVLSTAKVDDLEFDEEYLRAECGVNNARLVASAAAKGLAGLQCLAGVPGSVGGSLVMNAGGRFGEIADCVREVEIIDAAGVLKTLYRDDIDFRYRHSGLDGSLVVSGLFKLRPVADRLEIKDETRRIRQLKMESQPLAAASAGCIFRNPDGDSAGRLIDAAGLKNARVGGAVVSDQHANFIVNDNEATYDDVMALIRQVKATVLEKHGVQLELEVRVWGEK